MELRVLVIDPGETCGYAVFSLQREEHPETEEELRSVDLELLETWEGSGVFIPSFVIPFLKDLKRVKPSLVLIEDYRVYQSKAGLHIGMRLHTPELIGAIEGVCALTVPPMRTARIAAGKKSRWPEARMKVKFPQAKDVTGHARDAVKLGLAFLELKGLWSPSKEV
jgi:hypothetical protein